MTAEAICQWKFLDIFEYQRMESSSEGTIFHNCRMLRNFGGVKKGSLYDTIMLQLNILAWNGNDNLGPVEDETVVL